MDRSKDDPHGAGDVRSRPNTPGQTLMDAATLAARMLAAAWAVPGADELRAEVVRDLARGLEAELEAMAGLAGSTSAGGIGVVVDGASRAADVANLAASSLPDLPTNAASEAAAATHLAAGAARAMCAVVEASAGDDSKAYALKDVRSARWRARFAVRQVDEFGGVQD